MKPSSELSYTVARKPKFLTLFFAVSARGRFRLKYSEEIERVDSDCHARSILP